MFDPYILEHLEKLEQRKKRGDVLQKTIRGLGKLGVAIFSTPPWGKVGLSIVLDGLRERDELIRYAAAEKLVKMKTLSPDLLRALLQDENRHVRRWIAYVIGSRKEKQLEEDLFERLTDRDLDVAKWSAWALEELGNTFVLPISKEKGALRKKSVQVCPKCETPIDTLLSQLSGEKKEKSDTKPKSPPVIQCSCGVFILLRKGLE